MSDMSTPQIDGKTVRRAAWRSIRGWLVIVGAQLTAGLLLSHAGKQGLIDGEGVMRGVLVIIGLGLAASGNMIPKTTDGLPLHTLSLAVLRQKTLRIAGWALTLGGLVFAALSAFAPLQFGLVAATVALGGSLAVMCGFVAYWIFAYHHRHNAQTRDEP